MFFQQRHSWNISLFCLFFGVFFWARNFNLNFLGVSWTNQWFISIYQTNFPSHLTPVPSCPPLSRLCQLKVWTVCCEPPWTWSWTCRCPERGRPGWRRNCGCCGSWKHNWRMRGSKARKSCPPGSKKTNASGSSSGRPRNRWTRLL